MGPATIRAILQGPGPAEARLVEAARVVRELTPSERARYPHVPWAVIVVAAEIVERGDASGHEIHLGLASLSQIAGLIDLNCRV